MNYTTDFLANAKAITENQAYAAILTQMQAARDQYAADGMIGFHLNALCDIMPRLVGAVAAIEKMIADDAASAAATAPEPAPVSTPAGPADQDSSKG